LCIPHMPLRLFILATVTMNSLTFFFQAEDGIRDDLVTGVQTCALPIYLRSGFLRRASARTGRRAECRWSWWWACGRRRSPVRSSARTRGVRSRRARGHDLYPSINHDIEVSVVQRGRVGWLNVLTMRKTPPRCGHLGGATSLERLL